MVFSEYTKLRIPFYYEQGKAPPSISRHLLQEGIVASRRGILKFLKPYEETGTIARKRGTGCAGKVTGEIKKLIEEQMNTDDETTVSQLVEMLASKGHRISWRAVERWGRALGWTFTGSAYCKLICDANKEKRLQWAQQYLGEATDGFQDVIWSDESTVQLETHRRFCCRKRGQLPRNKPR